MGLVKIIFGIIGGLGLFLFGMSLMSDGIKALAGGRLKFFLTALTRRRFTAVLLGAFATMLVQSSSATTVMTVGFVNAGLLTLRQALCVVLGANVGTTVTAWLISLLGLQTVSITAYALPMAGIGFFMNIACRDSRKKSTGMTMLGFGLLFIGVSFMQETFAPLRDCPDAQQVLIRLGGYPLLALLAGTILTILMQSSSASIMVIQVLALQGAFGTDWNVVLNMVLPFVLGDNIGTTITAQLAAIRSSRNAKRTAMGHTIFNIIGVIYILPFVWSGAFGAFISRITPWELSQHTIMADIAAANTLIKIINTAIFLPLIGVLETSVIKILPIKPGEADEKPVALDEHLLDTPEIAFQQVHRELLRMVKITRKAASQAIAGLLEDSHEKLAKVHKNEKKSDEFQYEITAYLSRLARRPLPGKYSDEIPVLLHTVNDLERVGDLAVNIAEVAERKWSQKIEFSPEAMNEAREIEDILRTMFACTRAALKHNDKEAAEQALAIENKLNAMQTELRKNHVRRMGCNECSPESGLIFIDLVDNAEKIGDHLTNIAQSVIGGLQWEHHE